MTASDDSSKVKFYPASYFNNMSEDQIKKNDNLSPHDNLSPLEIQKKVMGVTGDTIMAKKAYKQAYDAQRKQNNNPSYASNSSQTKFYPISYFNNMSEGQYEEHIARQNYIAQQKQNSTPSDADHDDFLNLFASDNSSDNQDLEQLFKLFADEDLYDNQDNERLINSTSTISIPTRPSSILSTRPSSIMSTTSQRKTPGQIKKRVFEETDNKLKAQEASDEAKKVHDRDNAKKYRESDKGKVATAMYRQSPSYKASQQRRLEKKRLKNATNRQSVESTSSNNLIENDEFNYFDFLNEDDYLLDNE